MSRWGRFVDDVDVGRRARVCVLGDELKQRLFRFTDPIGQYVKVADNNFRVIGVMEERKIPSGKAIVSLRDMKPGCLHPDHGGPGGLPALFRASHPDQQRVGVEPVCAR